MNNVYYQPWVGDQYQAAPLGKRILILGESHYQKEPRLTDDWYNLTRECVEAQIRGDYKKQFWTNIVIAFLNRYPTLSDKATFWHSVAFYNYVQQSVGATARIRPRDQMWQSSEAAFEEVLKELKPEILIVLGYSLWRNLPSQASEGPAVLAAKQTATRYYFYPSGSCVAYGIRHPSSGFSGYYWYPYIQQIINLRE